METAVRDWISLFSTLQLSLHLRSFIIMFGCAFIQGSITATYLGKTEVLVGTSNFVPDGQDTGAPTSAVGKSVTERNDRVKLSL
jgi:hypothetical protein